MRRCRWPGNSGPVGPVQVTLGGTGGIPFGPHPCHQGGSRSVSPLLRADIGVVDLAGGAHGLLAPAWVGPCHRSPAFPLSTCVTCDGRYAAISRRSGLGPDLGTAEIFSVATATSFPARSMPPSRPRSPPSAPVGPPRGGLTRSAGPGWLFAHPIVVWPSRAPRPGTRSRQQNAGQPASWFDAERLWPASWALRQHDVGPAPSCPGGQRIRRAEVGRGRRGLGSPGCPPHPGASRGHDWDS